MPPRTAFRPGQSGNPGGRPKLTPEQKAQALHLYEACRLKTLQAIEVIEQLMYKADRDSVRLAAAQFIIERGWGKTPPPVGPPVEDKEHTVEVIFVEPDGTRYRE